MRATFNSGFTVCMTKKQAEYVSFKGSCLNRVQELLQDTKYRKQFLLIPDSLIKKELFEMGGWELEELENLEENLERITWIAGGIIKEDLFYKSTNR